jgi:hypothetical protein
MLKKSYTRDAAELAIMLGATTIFGFLGAVWLGWPGIVMFVAGLGCGCWLAQGDD